MTGQDRQEVIEMWWACKNNDRHWEASLTIYTQRKSEETATPEVGRDECPVCGSEIVRIDNRALDELEAMYE